MQPPLGGELQLYVCCPKACCLCSAILYCCVCGFAPKYETSGRPCLMLCAVAPMRAASMRPLPRPPGGADGFRDNPYELPSVDDLEVAALAAASAMAAMQELQQPASSGEDEVRASG